MAERISEFMGVKLPELSPEWAWAKGVRNFLGICEADKLETDHIWYWVWYYPNPKEAALEKYGMAVWKQRPDYDEKLVFDNVRSVEDAVEMMYATLLFNMED